MCGGLSMALAHATLARILERPLARRVALAAFATAYGVTGVFFGHVEHYSIMSLGCFAFVYAAVRYLAGELPLGVAGLVLGLLLATHLMAAWLVPSLFVLAWLGPADEEQAGEGRRREALRRALAAGLGLGIPTAVTWGTVLVAYYDGRLANLLADARNGAYSKATRSVGNALGGGNDTWFLPLEQVFAGDHLWATAVLLALYSPLVFLALPAFVLFAPRGTAQRARSDRAGRFFLGLLVPYALYVLSWHADLGYARDWDLFSHVTIFAIFTGCSLAAALPASAWKHAVVAVGLALSAATTGYVVVETARAETPSGVERVLVRAGVEGGRRAPGIPGGGEPRAPRDGGPSR